MGFSAPLTMAQHNELGQKGESAAVDFLKEKGHQILERNWRLHGYEIDIITLYEGYIVFVEVKTRSSDLWGDPESFVDKRRMKRMIRAAHHYLVGCKIDLPTRFDIVAVLREGKEYRTEHFEDAFRAF